MQRSQKIRVISFLPVCDAQVPLPQFENLYDPEGRIGKVMSFANPVAR